MPVFDPDHRESIEKLQNYNNELYTQLNQALSREAALTARVGRLKKEVDFLTRALNGGLTDDDYT